MKKNMLVLIGALAVAVSSCTAQKKTAKKTNSLKNPVFTAVTLNRTACFGRCPIYSMEIRNDGTAIYTGKRFTEYSGTYTRNIGATKAADILQQFSLYRADTCRDNYEVLISDVPGIDFTLVQDSQKKNIGNANFGPHFLQELAVMIDDRVKVDATWKKIADAEKQ